MENTAKRTILYCGDFSNRCLFPFPLKLLKSEIWDIKFFMFVIYFCCNFKSLIDGSEIVYQLVDKFLF